MIVKICGLTAPEDAAYAARTGADYVGMIFVKRSKRCISLVQAQEMVQAIVCEGAEPVAVFEGEETDQIDQICQMAQIKTVQIYSGTIFQVKQLLKRGYRVFFTISVQMDGTSQIQSIPKGTVPLFDCLKGGTGKAFDWSRFIPPKKGGWMLAGGLTPSNVEEAIHLLHPSGVDVASGVEIAGSTRKNPALVEAFIHSAKQSTRRA